MPPDFVVAQHVRGPGVEPSGGPLPDVAFLLALSTLPGVGPRRLRAFAEHWSPSEAWHAVVGAHPGLRQLLQPSLRERIVVAARECSVEGLWQQHVEHGVGVVGPASPGFPAELSSDIDPPHVLTWMGNRHALGPARVAIVGTRTCTRYGRDIAVEFGAALSRAGVTVVSGLALGIDAAAHEGVLQAGGAAPVAVVGSGLDVVYPRRNRALWDRIGAEGLLISEYPLGVRPDRWRFPARNRIIAALADVVVVVESHEKGGSMLTAAEAAARGKPVLAVPGPVRSSASTGTIRLLRDGAEPVADVDDVLCALGLAGIGHRTEVRAAQRQCPVEQAVLSALQWQPVTLDQLMARVGVGAAETLSAIAALEEDHVVARRGPWLEQCVVPV